MRPSFLLAATFVGAFSGLATVARADSPSVSYDLAMPKPASHRFEVTLHIAGLSRAQTTVAMPIWIPGYYSDDHYARNVASFSVSNSSGTAVPWSQDGDSAWKIASGGASALTVRYQLYANRPADIGTQLAAQRAEFNGAQTFLYLEDGGGYPAPGPVTLTVRSPAGWRMASGLIAMATGPATTSDGISVRTFRAPTYDVLVDCPTVISPGLRQQDFTVAGKTYHLSIEGPGNYDLHELAEVAQKIIGSEVKMFGHSGYSEYWPIFLTASGGGMEHLNSTISGMRAYGWENKHDPKAKVLDDEHTPMNGFALVLAHEHFHSWNVKRIRPQALGPFRYDREVHTRRLDVAEGFTEYYTFVHGMRSGYASPEATYETFAGALETEETAPGRKVFSLGDLSWNTWWASDDRSIPAGDYYDGAAIMSLMLDLKIRHDTGNKHSLDDVLRYLFADWERKKVNEFVSPGGTYGDDQLPSIIEAATGDAAAGQLFRQWWDTTTLPDWNQYLDYAGLTLKKTPPKTGKVTLDADTFQVGAPTGVGFSPRSRKLGYGIPQIAPDELMISQVEPNGAAERAGLEVYDVLVAVDGEAAGETSLPSILASHKPGDRIEVTVRREGRLVTASLILVQAHVPKYAIEAVPNPTSEQKALRADFEAGRPF